ncbi:MAG TPA: GNAT family N-acetyltransferase [Acetobacteraceae bacterium]|nr:GNAT family N-acetyltransferase [Acetobacteraceae bacterium]
MIFRVEIVTDVARFTAVQGAWRALWERTGAFIFQDHAWIGGWLTGMRDRREMRLQIALAWDGDRLCGVMPCAIHRRSGLRVLTWAAQLFSDYCDCLIDPAYAGSTVFAALWDGLNRFGGFDLISLQQIRPDSQCLPFLGQGRLQPADRSERCMRIDNEWADGEAFFRSLNKKGRNNHTRGKRILAELGGDVSFRFVDKGEEPASLFDEIIALKHAWLRVNDPTSSLLGGDGVVLRAILDHIWRSGLAMIFILECGGKIAAASVNFVYQGRMEAYFTAYDAAFDRASPGTILIVEYARWSFDHGLKHVDFLRGEEPFKFRLANNETLLSSFSGARTFVGQMAISGHRWLARRRQRQELTNPTQSDELEAVG